ncbi:hypothetical protein [Mycobacteroides franklinii]|uniref:hypothetical protein n=1 Tax=Mycobacteroides franklinii TaxID=948102 RepID=UPI0013F4F7A2|nr:hypothetical protein [Mycobacteroides franklinii]
MLKWEGTFFFLEFSLKLGLSWEQQVDLMIRRGQFRTPTMTARRNERSAKGYTCPPRA